MNKILNYMFFYVFFCVRRNEKETLFFKESVDPKVIICKEGLLKTCGKKKPNSEILKNTEPSTAARNKAEKRIRAKFLVSDVKEKYKEKKSKKDLARFLSNRFMEKDNDLGLEKENSYTGKTAKRKKQATEKQKLKNDFLKNLDCAKIMINIRAAIDILIKDIPVICENKIRKTFFVQEKGQETHERPIGKFQDEINQILKKYKIDYTMNISQDQGIALRDEITSYLLTMGVLTKCVDIDHNNPFIFFTQNRIFLIGMIVQIIISLLGVINFLQNSGTRFFKSNGQQMIQQTPAGKSLSPSLAFLILSASYVVFFIVAYILSLGSRGTFYPRAYHLIYIPEKNEEKELEKEGNFPGKQCWPNPYPCIRSLANFFCKHRNKKEESEDEVDSEYSADIEEDEENNGGQKLANNVYTSESEEAKEESQEKNQELDKKGKKKEKKKQISSKQKKTDKPKKLNKKSKKTEKTGQDQKQQPKENKKQISSNLKTQMQINRNEFLVEEFLKLLLLVSLFLPGFLSKIICGQEEIILLADPSF